MKIALYIEDGREQIVLTPETKTEQGILAKMHDGSRTFSLYRGEFYGCAGGWTRWRDAEVSIHAQFRPQETADKSTIIVLEPTKEPE